MSKRKLRNVGTITLQIIAIAYAIIAKMHIQDQLNEWQKQYVYGDQLSRRLIKTSNLIISIVIVIMICRWAQVIINVHKNEITKLRIKINNQILELVNSVFLTISLILQYSITRNIEQEDIYTLASGLGSGPLEVDHVNTKITYRLDMTKVSTMLCILATVIIFVILFKLGTKHLRELKKQFQDIKQQQEAVENYTLKSRLNIAIILVQILAVWASCKFTSNEILYALSKIDTNIERSRMLIYIHSVITIIALIPIIIEWIYTLYNLYETKIKWRLVQINIQKVRIVTIITLGISIIAANILFLKDTSNGMCGSGFRVWYEYTFGMEYFGNILIAIGMIVMIPALIVLTTLKIKELKQNKIEGDNEDEKRL